MTEQSDDWKRPPLDLEAVFNTDNIQKGDVFKYDVLGDLIDETPGTSLWNAKLTGIAKDLQRILWSKGKPFTLRVHRNNLVVLTDAQAAKFNRKHFASGRRRMALAHKQAIGVDLNSLDEKTRKAHERTLISQGVELASLAAARKEVRAIAHKRNRPMLPGSV